MKYLKKIFFCMLYLFGILFIGVLLLVSISSLFVMFK